MVMSPALRVTRQTWGVAPASRPHPPPRRRQYLQGCLRDPHLGSCPSPPWKSQGLQARRCGPPASRPRSRSQPAHRERGGRPTAPPGGVAPDASGCSAAVARLARRQGSSRALAPAPPLLVSRFGAARASLLVGGQRKSKEVLPRSPAMAPSATTVAQNRTKECFPKDSGRPCLPSTIAADTPPWLGGHWRPSRRRRGQNQPNHSEPSATWSWDRRKGRSACARRRQAAGNQSVAAPPGRLPASLGCHCGLAAAEATAGAPGGQATAAAAAAATGAAPAPA